MGGRKGVEERRAEKGDPHGCEEKGAGGTPHLGYSLRDGVLLMAEALGLRTQRSSGHG